MPGKPQIRYQVFVSSTFGDNQHERRAVLRAVHEAGAFPIESGLFVSNTQERRESINDEIRLSDYFVLVLAQEPHVSAHKAQSSFEAEYRYAAECGKPVLVFLHEKGGIHVGDRHEALSNKLKQIDKFRSELLSTRLIKYFSGPDDLHVQLSQALLGAFTSSPQVGWLRRSAEIRSEAVLQGGLSGFRTSSQSLSSKEIIEESNELVVVMNDGRAWVEINFEALERKLTKDESFSLRLILLHPQSHFLPTMVLKNGKSLAAEINDIQRSLAFLERLKAGAGNRVQIYGHRLFNPYALILSDTTAYVMPYFLNESSQLPVCIFTKGQADDAMYFRYRNDAISLIRKADPLAIGEVLTLESASQAATKITNAQEQARPIRPRAALPSTAQGREHTAIVTGNGSTS